MRLLLDELYSNAITEVLRSAGYDVISALDIPDVRNRADSVLLAWAEREGRAVVTENVGDYAPLHREYLLIGKDHWGIIVTSPQAMSRARDPVGRFVRALDALLKAHQADDALRDTIRWLQTVD